MRKEFLFKNIVPQPKATVVTKQNKQLLADKIYRLFQDNETTFTEVIMTDGEYYRYFHNFGEYFPEVTEEFQPDDSVAPYYFEVWDFADEKTEYPLDERLHDVLDVGLKVYILQISVVMQDISTNLF